MYALTPFLNPYTTISGTTLTIAPTLQSHVGISVISVRLSYSIYSTLYTFTINVQSYINFSPPLEDKIVSVSTPGTYPLPTIIDIGSYPVTLTCTIPASFITYNSGTKTFSFNPTTAADLGVWNVVLNLVDTASYTAIYSFNVTVQNELPAYLDPTVTY
jgi:hypothetical protein